MQKWIRIDLGGTTIKGAAFFTLDNRKIINNIVHKEWDALK